MKKSLTIQLGIVVSSVLAASLGLPNSALAGTLTSGPISIPIRDDNGAIDNAFFNEEFYELGIRISDYGFQAGTATSTFSRATESGLISGPIAISSVVSGSNLETVSGNYTGGGADIGFTKEYSLIGDAVLKTKVTLANIGTTTTESLRYYFTADPDQGSGSATSNDVFPLAGGAVAQATGLGTGRSVVIGTSPSASETGFSGGFGLGIGSGSELNNFFTLAADPDGVVADIGFAIGFERTLLAGESTMFTYYQAFGDTAEAARTAFVAAVGADTEAIPTPALLPGLIGMGVAALRKRKGEAATEEA